MLFNAQPCIGFGQVRHTRLQPKRHAFAYRTYFLMLPMRSLKNNNGALAVNRFSALSFFDKDHGDGRSPKEGGAGGQCVARFHRHEKEFQLTVGLLADLVMGDVPQVREQRVDLAGRCH